MIPPGLDMHGRGTRFRVHAPDADQLWLCLFDARDGETRLPMMREGEGIWSIDAPGVGKGARYGLRANGPYDPDAGLWFDPDKLLLDPYAPAIDRPFAYDPMLAAPRGQGRDTAALMPKGVVTAPFPPVAPEPPIFQSGGLIYEVQVRGFTMLHPDIPEAQRGTIAALGHPAVIQHLRRLHVSGNAQKKHNVSAFVWRQQDRCLERAARIVAGASPFSVGSMPA